MQLGMDNQGDRPHSGKRIYFAMGASMLWLVAMFLASASAKAHTLSAGFDHSCAVTDRGGVMCWGDNSYYGLGDDSNTASMVPVGVLGLGAVITDVEAGSYYTCALTSGGAIKCWGYNGSGQIGNGSQDLSVRQPATVLGLGAGARAIAVESVHACALTGTGGVRCWGSNENGGLGNGTQTSSRTPVDVVGLETGATAIVVGWEYSCALTANGAVKCWGRNSSGQLGDGTTTNRLVPVAVVGLTSGVVAIAAGTDHTCALSSTGRVKCWGANVTGQLGNASTADSLVPVEATSLAVPAKTIAAGEGYTCVRTEADTVKCWGSNWAGQLGDGTTTGRPVAADVAALGSGVAALATGWSHACARLQSGEIKCWGDGRFGQLGNGVPVQRPTAVGVAGLNVGTTTAISTAEHHSCAVTAAGAAVCWGSNRSRELGDGTRMPHAAPAEVVGLGADVRMIATGGSHSCAVTSGGGALCWGWNATGQLGDGSRTDRAAPVSVMNMGANAAALALGEVHSCALTVDGGVRCWGDNSVGQLGSGMTIPDRPMPVQVAGLESGVVAISSGPFHSCALTGEGGVKCWGQNAAGMLGDGTTNNHTAPVSVVGLADAIAIGAGEQQTCALTRTGAVKCWGNGQLTPAVVPGMPSGITAIAVGGTHACVLTMAGGLECWGSNYFGQLGDGTTIDRPLPVDVDGLTSGVASVVAGRTSTCAVTTEGAAKCWGSNADGQLGNGEIGYALLPQTVFGTLPDPIFLNGFD